MEVQSVLDAGLSVAFYRVGDDLSIDEEDLMSRLRSRPGPVLIIHYFGHGQPGTARIADACARYRVPLIEDCCHALYSSLEGRPLGSTGVAAAFSLRKTLGTWDGALLRFNARGQLAGYTFHPPSLERRARWPYRIVAARAIARLFPPMRERLEGGWARSPENGPVDLRPELRVWHPSERPASRAAELYRTLDSNDVVRRRRANWTALRDALHHATRVRPVWTRLAEGECPLGFIVRVPDRSRFIERLERVDIWPHVFGAVPHPTLPLAEFPDSKRLRDEIVCLPAHHALESGDLERIVTAVLAAAE